MNRARIPLMVAFIVGLVLVGYRLFMHSSTLLTPVILTPDMDAHRMLAPSLDARFARLGEELQGHARSVARPRLIALTFDDGPYAVTTPLLLSELQELHVPATFFLIGRDVVEEPELTARIVRAGFEVANHTYTHPNLDEISGRDVSRELIESTSILARFTHDAGPRRYFRPPHGRYTEATIRIAQTLGYTTVLWNDDAGDWNIEDSAKLVAHIEAHAMAPEVLLLHSGHIATIEMLAQIVPAFRAVGYQFVTVGQLLQRVSPEVINHAARVHALH